MGHIRLGNLPKTRNWKQVLSILDETNDPARIAAGTLKAVSSILNKVPDDPGLVHCFWLLTQLPFEAKSPDFFARTKKLGFKLSPEPSLLELTSAFTKAIDDHIRENGRRTDLAEIAQLAAAESLTACCAEKTRSLFGSKPDDLRNAVGDLASPKQFSYLSKKFFAGFTQRYLSYFLSKELSNHIGAGKTFSNIREHTEFNNALKTYCQESAKIVENFSGGWFSKTNFFEGKITPEKAKGFLHVAFKKIVSELKRDGAGHEG